MKIFNLVTLVLVIIGGINWGLIGLFNYNLVGAIFGFDSFFTNLLYVLVGVSAIYQLVPFAQACDVGEVNAEAAKH